MHEIGTTIAALAAAIAAYSSLRNGRTLKKNGNASDERTRKRAPKKTSNGDWFKPPEFK